MAKAHCTDDGRVCTICGEFKGWDCFGSLKLGERGKASNCLVCAKWYGRIRRAKPGQERDDLKGQLAALKSSAAEVIRSINQAVPTATCSWCRLELPRSMFGPDKTRLNGLKVYCKKCKALESRRYRLRNPEAAARSSKNWAAKNRDKVEAKRRRWQERNPGRQAELARRWRGNNSDRYAENAARYTSRPDVRLHRAIRERIRSMIKGKTKRTFDLLPYTVEELMAHLERQFLKGMSWDNYGEWHIDHIVPLSSFRIESEDCPDVQIAWGLSNLRPLWGSDNLKKSANRIYLI